MAHYHKRWSMRAIGALLLPFLVLQAKEDNGEPSKDGRTCDRKEHSECCVPATMLLSGTHVIDFACIALMGPRRSWKIANTRTFLGVTSAPKPGHEAAPYGVLAATPTLMGPALSARHVGVARSFGLRAFTRVRILIKAAPRVLFFTGRVVDVRIRIAAPACISPRTAKKITDVFSQSAIATMAIDLIVATLAQ